MNKNKNQTTAMNVCEHYKPDETCVNVECQPNQYPGYLEKAMPMSIVGTETGSHISISGLITASHKCADRTLLMTPWGDYVIFKIRIETYNDKEISMYYLYDGCTCNANSFRYLDLREGTAGFLSFYSMNSLVNYILNSRYKKEKLNLVCKQVLDDICIEKRPTGEEEAVGNDENAI